MKLLMGTRADQALLFFVAISTVFYVATATDATSETDDADGLKEELGDSTLTRRKRADASPIEWKVDGEVNWADGCDFWSQDFTYVANTKKEACGSICLANPKCDHFTWDVLDNGKCWLKHWVGDQPTIQQDGRRCGVIPSRLVNVKALEESVAGLIATVAKLQSQQNVLSNTVTGPMAMSCVDLKQLGHLKNGFYMVKSPSKDSKLISVYCDFTLQFGAKGFETVIGYNDVKTAAGIYFYVQRSSNFTSTMTVIPWDLEKLNIGRAMNLATGVFTAPVNGRYQFIYNALSGSSATVENDVWLRVNGARFGTSSAPAPNHVNMPISATLNLKIGDTVDMVLAYGALFDNIGHISFFSGFLLEEDLSF